MHITDLVHEFILSSALEERQNLKYREYQVRITHQRWEGDQKPVEISGCNFPNLGNSMSAADD